MVDTQHAPSGRHTHRKPAGWPWRAPVAALEAFVALGGLYGGVAMIRDPLTAFGATTTMIAGSPFHTFTWPGVMLLVLNGVIPGLLAAAVLTRVDRALQLSGAYGVGLMAWIVTQWVMLDDRLWLQPAMFAIGAALLTLSVLAGRRGYR